MAQGLISPLALTAGRNFYNTAGNTGVIINAVFSTNMATYESNSLMSNLLPVIADAASNVSLSISAGTLAALKTMGNTSGAALADSVPSGVSITIGNTGLTGQMLANASTYLGNGNFSIFAQAFGAATGYIGLTNLIINSAVNADEYLGPTYQGMDSLISGDLARVNLAYEAFGEDLQDLGSAFDFGNLDQLLTPAGLLQQISTAGNMVNGTLPTIQDALLDQGLTIQDITDLVNNNIESLFNPNGLTSVEFDRLQKKAYPALCAITGTDLQEVLTILDVTTPNIEKLCDLLDPKKIFPRSYPSLTLPVLDDNLLIYQPDGTVNPKIEPLLNGGTLTPVGCDQLSKIIPPDQAVVNRALQVAFGQIKNINDLTLAQMAGALL